MKPFTPEQQAQHCLQLADILRKVPSGKYDHKSFFTDGTCETPGCAFGWAMHFGVGGLSKADLFSVVHGVSGNPVARAKQVFGDGAFSYIFSGIRYLTDAERKMGPRRTSIRRLKEHASRLLGGKQ